MLNSIILLIISIISIIVTFLDISSKVAYLQTIQIGKDLKISSPSLRYVDDHIPTKVTSASAFSHSHKLKKFITRTPFSQKQQYELKFPANKYSKEHEIEIKAGPKYPEIDNCLLAPFPCNHPEFPRITDIHQAQTERRQSIPSSTQQSKRQCYHDRKDLPADGPIKQHCFDSCTSQQTQYSQPQLSQLSHDATLKKCCSQENKICDEQPSSPTVGKPQKQSLMIPDQQTNNHQLCTKEEIERKRIKAKILRNKMQAIRKRQAKQRYMKQQLQTCPSRHAHCFHSV